MHEGPQSAFERTLIDDASEVARRTLRNKFGRLSNLRILTVLRAAAAEHPDLREAPDEELLAQWFAAYAVSLERLRARSREQRPTTSQ